MSYDEQQSIIMSMFVTAGLSHKKCLSQLQDMLDRLYHGSGDNNELELEARTTLSQDEFTRMLAHAPTRPQFNEKLLDVYFYAPGNVLLRARVRGEERIRQVVADMSTLSSASADASLVEKARISHMHVNDNTRFVLSSERPVPWTDEIVSAVSLGRKAFRMKHVFSYPLASGKARVDMMIVRSSKSSSVSFCTHMDLPSSGILQAPEVYECEMELVPPSDAGHAPLGDASKVMDIVSKLMFNKLPPEDMALWTYLQCTHPNVDTLPCLKDARCTPHRFSIAPQPAALKRRHISVSNVLNVPHIYDDLYTVTVKLDGQRCVLVGDSKGQMYMMDSNLRLMHVLPGISCPAASCVVCEGEFLAADNTVHLFDIYYRNNTSLLETPFFAGGDSRYRTLCALVEDITKACGTASTIKIVAKEFLKCTRVNVADMLIASTAMASDGLVFTPCDLPVDMLWARVLKWKPVHTVDFKVVHDNDQDATYLQVGGMEPVSLVHQVITQYSVRPKYTHMTFPHHGVVRPRITTCADGTPVSNNCVVECEWDSSAGEWRAIKLRDDKMRYDPAKGARVCHPNDMHTALDTWHCITENVRAEDLLGIVDVDNVVSSFSFSSRLTLGCEDPYYASTQDRSKLLVADMLHFHNDGVKNRKLISPLAQNAKSILDIACGRGGDLFKWLKRPPHDKLYVGIDVCRSNLCDPSAGACSRACKLTPSARRRVYFMCADASKSLGPECGKGDDDSLKISRHLWGDKRLPNVPRDFGVCAESGFDVVSCQFAVHYFFGGEDPLTTFLDNVVSTMRPGGHFIGTCLDGNVLENALKNIDFGGSIRGESRTVPNHYLWCVHKKYRNEDPILGRRVGVFLESTGQIIDEFLVDFEYLVYELQERGVELKDTGLFRDAHDPVVYPMSEPERALSYMNRYFVFRKRMA